MAEPKRTRRILLVGSGHDIARSIARLAEHTTIEAFELKKLARPVAESHPLVEGQSIELVDGTIVDGVGEITGPRITAEEQAITKREQNKARAAAYRERQRSKRYGQILRRDGRKAADAWLLKVRQAQARAQQKAEE